MPEDALSRAKAYSYLRFSTPEQQKGDSLRRQTAMALDYAKRHGLDLDLELTFEDLGVSAFRGQNADAGRLAYFLEAVRSGLVPQGSTLLVEQLDRISRLTPRRALRVLEDIVDAGVTVVTMNDGRAYSSGSLDSDPMDLMVAVLTFMRANQESDVKSRRLKDAWEAKRSNIATKPLTSRTPAWIRLNPKTTRLELISERAEIVRRIFELTAEGVGQHKIAETFNREGLPIWGRGALWQRSYVAKILSNPAVIGTYAPGVTEYEGQRKTRRLLEPVEGYFPAAVPLELWREVQALRSTHRAPSRGRHASKPISNILAGLAACPVCGATSTRVQKGKKSVPSFVCTRAKAGAGCTYKAVRYEWVETAVVERLPARLRDTPAGGGVADIDTRLGDVEGALDALRDKIENLVANLSVSHSSALSTELRKREGELEALLESRAGLLEKRVAATGPLVTQRVQRLLEALEGPLDRAVANQAMRSVFSRVVVDYVSGNLEFEWTHGGTCEVPFMWPST